LANLVIVLDAIFALLVPFVAVLLHIMTNGRLRRHQDPLLAVLQQWFIHHPFGLI